MQWELIVQSAFIWASYQIPRSPYCMIYLWRETERENHGWSLLEVKDLNHYISLEEEDDTICVEEAWHVDVTLSMPAYHILLLRQPVLLSLCWLCCFLFFRNLIPVTQLYVSVDASSKESLKKIDRPLFKDYWPRFLDSLKALSDKVNRPLSRIGQLL